MGKKIIELEKPKSVNKAVITFRIFQAIFFGVFALGLSMMSGDITTATHIPISALSITTTIFGLLGAIITGILAKQSEKW